MHLPLVAAAVLLLAAGTPAEAQFLETFEDPSRWGVQLSVTPRWTSSVDRVGDKLELDMTGSDFAVGFARGRMRSGHWGLSYVRRQWREGSACFTGECYAATDTSRLDGVAVNWFAPFGSPFLADRLQVGLHIDAGAGWFQGMVLRAEDGAAVPVADVLDEPWDNLPVPIVRADIAVGVAVAPGVKVIGSGGYGFLFGRRFGLSLAVFPGAMFDR